MLKLAVCLQGESQVKSNLQRGLSSNRQQQTLHLASTAIRVRRIAPSFVMELHDALRDENVMKSLSNTEYDAIILGTGIVESILSTSLALNGKKVLHLDKNQYYGSESGATLDYFALQDWISSCRASVNTSNISIREVKTTDEWELLVQSSKEIVNKFLFDISPRLLLGADNMVEILVSAGVGRYFDCAPIDTIMICRNDNTSDQLKKLKPFSVPCHKRDIFASKSISLIEKRTLMKFLTYMIEYDHQQNTGDKECSTLNDIDSRISFGRSLQRPQNKEKNRVAYGIDGTSFQCYLRDEFGFSENLIDICMFGVLNCQSDQTVTHLTIESGLSSMKKFLTSIGRFPPMTSAYVVPFYGTSELSQSFCRMCAVYGGVYVLGVYLPNLKVFQDSNVSDAKVRKFQDLRHVNGKVLKCEWLIGDATYLSALCMGTSVKTSRICRRRICVTRASLAESGDQISLTIAPNVFGNQNSIQVLQQTQKSRMSANDYFIWHMTMVTDIQDTSNALENCMQALLHCSVHHESIDVPNFALWTMEFDITETELQENSVPAKVLISKQCGYRKPLSFEDECAAACNLFEKVCPDAQFMIRPNAPNSIEHENSTSALYEFEALAASLDTENGHDTN